MKNARQEAKSVVSAIVTYSRRMVFCKKYSTRMAITGRIEDTTLATKVVIFATLLSLY